MTMGTDWKFVKLWANENRSGRVGELGPGLSFVGGGSQVRVCLETGQHRLLLLSLLDLEGVF